MTKLALLWHMHQPYYEDRASGEHILPWVRLHALKDYWGMVALLREFPDIRVTVNLVPSLLVQVEAFAAGRADDRHLVIGLKPAESLDSEERQLLVANGFHAPYERMIRPNARYAELYAKRLRPDQFTVADLRDLQVLHKLAWMDPDWPDPRLQSLATKQRYDEDDKKQLREIELDLLNAVIPAYREAAREGRLELSTSPFYHPILPLLCDSDVHLRAHPESTLPPRLFVHPADARDQVARAFEYHARVFGTAPRGVWPSEGSVSDEVIALLAQQGARWTATDEEILARSLGRGVTADDLYRPYALGSAPNQVRGLFRDHQLSDLIGFTYQSWDTQAAATDFVTKVREAGRRFAADAGGGEDAVVTVILDGENAWEYYPGGGRPFLRALYRHLLEAADIQTVTMSEAVAGPARALPSVFPGSWIGGDFQIWAGHGDDHRAWAQLAAARAALDSARARVAPETLALAREELFIAEGSDWFWWYGDDHSSDHDREFDDLFRRHVRNVYRALGLPTPDDLHRTNITTEPGFGPVELGILTSPSIDGRARDFTRWATAVDVPLDGMGGTMHRVTGNLVRGLRVAADRQYLYLRLDGPELVRRLSTGDLRLALLEDLPQAQRLELKTAPAGYDAAPRWRADEVVTVAVPFAILGSHPGEPIRASVLVTDHAGHVIEQHPAAQPMTVEMPTVEHDAMRWIV